MNDKQKQNHNAKIKHHLGNLSHLRHFSINNSSSPPSVIQCELKMHVGRGKYTAYRNCG